MLDCQAVLSLDPRFRVLPLKSKQWLRVLITGIQKKTSFKSNSEYHRLALGILLCTMSFLSLVLYREHQGQMSLYSWNFWIIGHITSRASFHKGCCLLWGVPTPGLKSILIGEAHLAFPGLPAAHTMGVSWFSISTGKGCFFLPKVS